MAESVTHMAVGNQRAALISKQLEGGKGGTGRGGASHITLSYIHTQSLHTKVRTACVHVYF
jgi:hypothetical protein